jgi:general secretion pathway protein D
LVEKKLKDQRKLGFNLLQIGTNASCKKEDSITFDARDIARDRGILSYMFSRKSSHHFPAVDIKFDFLLAQEDIKINAAPSVLALNQTQALISNVEELSINNGSITLQTSAGPTVEKSFTRAQYGTTILLTPTIHLPDEGDGPGFVSLQTKLEFDTTQRHSIDDRPPVTRRHVENEVRVADGETIILGGLRSKMEEDSREKIPFLGDLPGLGKLFGSTKMHESNTEMFIFITPHIIKDPVEDLRRIRQYEYCLRAGDIPEFLACIDEAKRDDRNQLFKHSMKLLFDMYD